MHLECGRWQSRLIFTLKRIKFAEMQLLLIWPQLLQNSQNGRISAKTEANLDNHVNKVRSTPIHLPENLNIYLCCISTFNWFNVDFSLVPNVIENFLYMPTVMIIHSMPNYLTQSTVCVLGRMNMILFFIFLLWATPPFSQPWSFDVD